MTDRSDTARTPAGDGDVDMSAFAPPEAPMALPVQVLERRGRPVLVVPWFGPRNADGRG